MVKVVVHVNILLCFVTRNKLKPSKKHKANVHKEHKSNNGVQALGSNLGRHEKSHEDHKKFLVNQT